MVDIAPFKGILYNPEKAGPFDQVMAPPYDVIKPDQQDALYERSPYNVVRLILGKEFPEDDAENNRYTRSASTFRDWLEQGILVSDETPSFYVYSQEYEFDGRPINRIGFFARVKLEDFERGNICPHEFTLAKAKQDRSQLISACKANFSAIFGLYSDPSGETDELFSATARQAPLGVIKEDGVAHRFWPLRDVGVIEKLTRLLADKKVYIADGHHRYETALAYHKAHGQETPDSAHVMMFLTNLDSPNLTVYAIHRQVQCASGFDAERFFAEAGRNFEIESLPDTADAGEIKQRLDDTPADAIAFVAYCGKGSCKWLRLANPSAILDLLEPGEPRELQVLSVSQLHTVLIKNLLGVDTRDPAQQSQVAYTIHIDEAMQNVDRGVYDVAFFMSPTPVATVRNLAEKGIRLPQKSTYFYPKLLSGLVINRFHS